MERVYSRKRTVLDRFCLPVERLIYLITAVDPVAEMTGRISMRPVSFSLVNRHASVVRNSKNAAVSSLVLSAAPYDSVIC